MPQSDVCPTARDFEQWVAGRSTTAEAERLAAHLEHCTACARRLDAAPPDGPLSELARGLARGGPPPEDEAPSVRSLIDLLCSLPQFAGDSDPGTPADLLDPPEEPGEAGRFGPYRVIEQVGRGGMGVVFRAVDTHLGRTVALKLLRPQLGSNPEVRRRFLSEARTAAALRHDHVAVIYQVGEVTRAGGAQPYIAMEFLEGENLADWLRHNPRPPLALILRFAREIAAGLAAAHALGIVHRDVKPGNVWVEAVPHPDRGEPTLRIRLLDFGLACTAASDDRATRAGTPGYMAPEQARGEAVDFRADLFGLGRILTGLVGGGEPTPAVATPTPLPAKFPPRAPAPHPGDTRPPPELWRLIDQLLAPRPEDRPPSARAVEQELLAIEARLARRKRSRARLLVAAAGVFAAVCVAVAAARPWETAAGTVEAAGGRAAVVLSRDGAEVARLSSGTGWRGVLPSGTYSAATDDEDVTVEPARFTLAAGQTQQLTLHGPPEGPVGEAWLGYVAGLSSDRQVHAVLRKLTELNPGFSGRCEFWSVEGGAVAEFRVHTDNIQDISPVRALTGLRTLGCTGTKPERGQLTDLSPVAGMKTLKGLLCWHNVLSDLSPLRGLQLREFQAEGTHITTLAPLEGMPITTLTVQFTRLRDLSPVRGMPLWLCYCNGTEITDLSPLVATPVQVLRCDFRPERDEAALKSIKTLTNVNQLPVEQFWRRLAPAPAPPS